MASVAAIAPDLGGRPTVAAEPTRLRRISYAVFCLKKKSSPAGHSSRIMSRTPSASRSPSATWQIETVTVRVYPVSRSPQLHHSELSQNSSAVSEVGLVFFGSMALI